MPVAVDDRVVEVLADGFRRAVCTHLVPPGRAWWELECSAGSYASRQLKSNRTGGRRVLSHESEEKVSRRSGWLTRRGSPHERAEGLGAGPIGASPLRATLDP